MIDFGTYNCINRLRTLPHMRARAGKYAAPDRLKLDRWALSGDWTIELERVRLNTPGGRIFFRFQAP